MEKIIKDEIAAYCRRNPGLEISDLFKYLFQSCFGCEHLVTDGESALEWILDEAKYAGADDLPDIEPLCGDWCRVHLKALPNRGGLTALCRVFLNSSQCRPEGRPRLEQCLAESLKLAREGLIPFDGECLEAAIREWREQGFPALHHSEAFRRTHHPAYRVIRAEYLRQLPIGEAAESPRG